MDTTAIWLTVRLATWTTVILLFLGLPLAYWLATTRRWWRFAIDAAVALPLLLPPTVLGFYLLVGLGPNSAPGRFYEALVGRALPFSFAGILLASVLYNLPFAVRPFAAAFAAVERRLVEASWCLGVSRAATFFRVVVPLAWPGILSGMVLAFAHTVGEFGVVLMVGGNIPGVTRTISIAIYDDVQALNYERAAHSALLLLVFAFTTLCVAYALERRSVRI
ncbi:MAG: molybdate ABC transporter permease subunit [Planctomycetia bacterium]|nr:molybdate ABC transporter permease subunit [Planctomycetia bacterium]